MRNFVLEIVVGIPCVGYEQKDWNKKFDPILEWQNNLNRFEECLELFLRFFLCRDFLNLLQFLRKML